MNNQKIKVLEISIVSHNTGGVEKILYDLFLHLDTEKFQIDFLSPDGGSYDVYEKKITARGGRVMDLGIDRISIKDKMIYNGRLISFLKRNRYDIVHINSGAFFFCLQTAGIAKFCGVPKVVVHSHNTMNYGRAKYAVIRSLKPMLEKLADYKLACSKAAGTTLFTPESIESGKVTVIHNGIEVKNFRYSSDTRKEYRKALGLEDCLVCCHVGRFTEQKNHTFLLDIFDEIRKMRPDAKLLLAGEGELQKEVEDKVEALGLTDAVRFLGRREDVDKMLNCIDVFLLPSLYEGLPIVAIEAQANGAVTVCSDAVTDETNISDTYLSIPLEKSAREWAAITLDSYVKLTDSVKREDQYKQIISAGYDIQSSADLLTDIYMS